MADYLPKISNSKFLLLMVRQKVIKVAGVDSRQTNRK